MMSAVYPGSFDPVTLGHLNIIRRASRIFDKLYVCVAVNSAKHPVFSVEERVDFLKRSTERFSNVIVESSDELLVRYAEERGIGVIVKGLRAVSDYESEFQMALANRKLNPNLETVFLPARGEYQFLSSSIVREIAGYGGDISGMVPHAIEKEIAAKLKK